MSEPSGGPRDAGVRSRIVARSRGSLSGLEPLIPSRFAPRADRLPVPGLAVTDASAVPDAEDDLAPGEWPGPGHYPAGLDWGSSPAPRGEHPAAHGRPDAGGTAAGDPGRLAPRTPRPATEASPRPGGRGAPGPSLAPPKVSAGPAESSATADRDATVAGHLSAGPGEPGPAAAAQVTTPGPVIISIGHIEVRAAAEPRSRPTERTAPPSPRPAFRPRVTLADFLDGDAGQPGTGRP